MDQWNKMRLLDQAREDYYEDDKTQESFDLVLTKSANPMVETSASTRKFATEVIMPDLSNRQHTKSCEPIQASP